MDVEQHDIGLVCVDAREPGGAVMFDEYVYPLGFEGRPDQPAGGLIVVDDQQMSAHRVEYGTADSPGALVPHPRRPTTPPLRAANP